MKSRTAIAAIAVSLSVVPIEPARAAVANVEEIVAGPANAGGLYVVSQNDARVAYVGVKGARTVVTVDGVDGPVLDELFNGSAAVNSGEGFVLVQTANAGGKFNDTPTAVIFSDNGSHYAYIGRQGNDYVVVHDGGEVGRGPRSALSLAQSPLGLSPGGKFAYWGEIKTENGRRAFRLMINGKAEPWAGHQDLKPVFSQDDSRYAYVASMADDYRTPVLVIDGKVASYVGREPQFTADGQHLLTTGEAKYVLVDGIRAPIEGLSIGKIVPAPVGSRFAAIMQKKTIQFQGVGTLYLDGHEVPGTEGAMDITFSPDGKRYALRCVNPETRSFFMVIDGKKGTEYQNVSDKAYWTPDSSTVIYSVINDGRDFVVVNTEELAISNLSALTRSPIAFAKKGGRYTFSSADGTNRNFLTLVDGKPVLPPGIYADGSTFGFGENGDRYAFSVGQIGRQGMVAVVDYGKVNDVLPANSFSKLGAELFNPYFILSPDGNYLARMSGTGATRGLYVNDKLVFPTSLPVAYPTFTPDSKHLFWLSMERTPGKPATDLVVYVDGQPTAKFDQEHVIGTKGAWRMDASGVVTCLGVARESVKRVRISAPADMNIDKMIARAEETQAKALADAVAARAAVRQKK